MAEDNFKPPLFSGKDFNNRKYRLELHLDELELLAHVQKDLEDLLEPHKVSEADDESARMSKEDKRHFITQNDKKCKNQIINRIHCSQLEVVKGKSTAYGVWKALEARFEARHTTARVNLCKQFSQLKYMPKQQTFREYCTSFSKILRELKEAGEVIDEEGEIIRFLMTMPESYDTVVSPLQTIASNLTMEYVQVSIEQFEIRTRDRAAGAASRASVPSAAFLAYRDGESSASALGKNLAICYVCGKRGHKKFECWRPGGGAYRGAPPPHRTRATRATGVQQERFTAEDNEAAVPCVEEAGAAVVLAEASKGAVVVTMDTAYVNKMMTPPLT